MQFDDRLATVLRMRTGSAQAAQTQFRQLLDLMGSAPGGADPELLRRACARLEELIANLAPAESAALIREPGMRLRNPALVGYLANCELPIVSAAMASARLSENQWLELIPTLPVPARGLLRHREDLPRSIRGLLARLGVQDLVLPFPGLLAEAAADEPAAQPAPPPAPTTAPAAAEPLPPLELEPALAVDNSDPAGIGALVKRIAAFQRARQQQIATPPANDAPRLPLGEATEEPGKPGKIAAFDFATDADGRIIWADPALAPMTIGIALAVATEDAPARTDPAVVLAMRRRQIVRGGKLVLRGAPAISGEWRIDAAPHFSQPGGRFTGYRGRMRRPAAAPQAIAALNPVSEAADRMRQLLHELRTPVNAIQGFAEIIQQQLFGPTPNEYRALAAAIAGDAARMLAGFEELDRLAKLETGALELDAGSSDLAAVIAATARQLDSVLRPRDAGFDLTGHEQASTVALAQHDAELLAWRVLATVAGASGPGEALRLELGHAAGKARLALQLPQSLAGNPDIFAAAPGAQAQSITSGMFGAGFTLRLARAEARAAGGELTREDGLLVLTVPLLTAPLAANSQATEYKGDGVIGAA